MKSPTPNLIKWLYDNSSGVYRPAAEAAYRLQRHQAILQQIIQDLPKNRDWLDPVLEAEAKALLNID